MRSFSESLLIFAVLLQIPAAWAAPGCEIRGSVDSQHIGPVRKQDGTGLCYAFTAVNLVQEKHCRIRAART